MGIVKGEMDMSGDEMESLLMRMRMMMMGKWSGMTGGSINRANNVKDSLTAGSEWTNEAMIK